LRTCSTKATGSLRKRFTNATYGFSGMPYSTAFWSEQRS